MNVNIKPDKVSIDGGRVVVKAFDDDYSVFVEGAADVSYDMNMETEPTHDPHTYSNNNGLTVYESAERAYHKMLDMLEAENMLEGGADDLWGAIKRIIMDEDTQGRHTVYSLAGGILKGYREGLYAGVPFSYIFLGVVDGKIVPKQTMKESRQTGKLWSVMFNRHYGR